MNRVKIYFNLETSAWHGHATESVWAEEMAVNKYRIANIPMFFYGASLDDFVSAREKNGLLFFDKIIIHSGHSTYRLLVEKTAPKALFDKYWEPLSKTGCKFETKEGTVRIIAIDVPPDVDVNSIYKLLEAGENNRVWTFEEGYCGHDV